MSEICTLYNVCSVHREGVQYIGRIMSTSGDIMSTSGGLMMHVREQGDKSLSIYFVLNIPQCTHDIPHMHHDTPRCTERTLYRVICGTP